VAEKGIASGQREVRSTIYSEQIGETPGHLGGGGY
jgi:hypothetical protein